MKDPTAASLPGATVVAEQAGTGLKFTAVADASGEYLLAQLPVGTYALTTSAPGFKQAALPAIAVHAGDRLRHEFTLEVGDRSEVIVVTEGCRGAATGVRRDQGHGAPGAGGGASAARAEISGPGDAERRRGAAAGRHARRRHAAGRHPGERAGTAQRAQPLPARRRHRHRPVLQQHGDFSVGGCGAGIQHRKDVLHAGIRRQVRRRDQRHHQVRLQRVSRQPVRVRAQRHVRRQELLRFAVGAHSAVPAEPVRRHHRRADHPEPDVFLGQLRRPARAQVADADVFGADGRRCAPGISRDSR